MKIDHLSPDREILNELGARLARVRKQQGHTQDQLAEEAGLGVATLRRIEDGQDSQLGSWLKLLKALHMTTAIDQLLPENFNSPMSEAKQQRGRRKKSVAGKKADAGMESVAVKQSEAVIVWGDENS